MKHTPSALKWLVPAILVLAGAAAVAGLWPGEGQPYTWTNHRGEQVTINARGLYYWDTVGSAAQMRTNDLVTLSLALPLLALSFWLTLQGSLRGRRLLTGTLGFIRYTYATMRFGAAHNVPAILSSKGTVYMLALISVSLPAARAGYPASMSEIAVWGLIGLGFLVSALILVGYVKPAARRGLPMAAHPPAPRHTK